MVRRCGEDPNQIFPLDAFNKQLKTFGRFGLPMALMLVPMITTKAEDLPDMDKMGELMAEFKKTGIKPKDMEEMEALFTAGNARVQARIRDVVEDIISYGYL